MPNELLQKLEDLVKQGKFPSVSEAIRNFIEVGIFVDSIKHQIKDPTFIKSIEELKQTEGVLQWLESLTDSQADAISMAINMEKQKRSQSRNLR